MIVVLVAKVERLNSPHTARVVLQAAVVPWSVIFVLFKVWKIHSTVGRPMFLPVHVIALHLSYLNVKDTVHIGDCIGEGKGKGGGISSIGPNVDIHYNCCFLKDNLVVRPSFQL